MSELVARSGSLLQYRELVNEMGGDPGSLLARAGLSSACLEDHDILIPATGLVKALELAAEDLDCPTFGLQLARKQSLEMLGPVGLLIQQSDTLVDALQGIRRYLHVHSQAGSIEIEVTREQVFIRFEPSVSFNGKNRQLIDLSLAVGYGILRGLLKQTFSLTSVYFSYEEPASISEHHQTFSCPLVFGAEVSGAMFSRAFLHRPIDAEQGRIKQFINAYIEKLDGSVQLSLEHRIRMLIRQFIPMGHSDIDAVSQVLGVNKRTLQRRLKEKGLSYQALLSDERKQIAIRYLKESNIQLNHLSDLLGYSELAAFSRSFKTWTGQTPTDYIRAETARLKLRASEDDG